jgi:ribosomal protein S18 acetylase RimI-like enzyme
VEILDATISDATEILSLQKISYLTEAKIYDDYFIPPLTQTLAELEADFERKSILKAVQDGRIVGSVNGFTKDDRCFIGRLMVHPEYQSRGIGSMLMETIENRFADVCSWELFTGELSVRNIRLYERLGYSVIRREKFEESRFDVVIMIKMKSQERGK